jgi:[ribosomal protein S5]-alanine N-acetyltransferase
MIETQRLILRPAIEEDYESCKLIWADPEVKKFSGGPVSEEELKQAFYDDLEKARGDYGFKSVIVRDSGLHIGDAGLAQKDIESRQEVEVMYFFNKDFWGRGYATEAAQALVEYGLKNLGLKRIVALIHPENMASVKVAERAGLSIERDVVTNSGNARKLYSIVK